MPHFIDRRLNPKNRSLGNRQRFIKRAREELRRSLSEQLKSKRIVEVDDAHAVPVPRRTTDEHTFHNATISGRRDFVLPGNKQYKAGDRIPKHGQQGWTADKGHSPSGDSEDDFRFVLSRDEVLDLFFEDLELPDLVKLDLKEAVTFKPRRAGYATTGAPTNINVGRTMRNSLGRRIALGRPKQQQVDALLTQIEALEAQPGEKTETARQRIAALQEDLTKILRRRKVIAYVDPVDIRFNRFEPKPVPNASAVMFCLMDVSGSMGEREKDLAKRFFVLLHLFLKSRYERTDIVFIRHTHEAQVVDEQTFFFSTQSGGTVVSSALEEMQRVIKESYPSDTWNIYAAQASDGDNSPMDSEHCISLLNDHLLKLCQYFAYVEIIDERERELFRTTENGTSLWNAYRKVSEKAPSFQMVRIAKPEDIYPVFRQLFAKRSSSRAGQGRP